MNDIYGKLNKKEIMEVIDSIIKNIEIDINSKFVEKNNWEKEKIKIINKEE